MPHTCFFYGTLTSPVVLKRVLGQAREEPLPDPLALRPATLDGYQRRAVKNASYPAIVRNAEATVEGMTVEGLSDMHLRLLDIYEGNGYSRHMVPVTGTDGQDRVAWVYIWKGGLDGLEDRDWKGKAIGSPGEIEAFLAPEMEEMREGMSNP